jgi:LPXTG-motif cell wall-anchored protein
MAGKVVTITVDAILDSSAAPNTDIVNKASLSYNGSTYTDGGDGAAPIHTFGFDFVKRDKDSGAVLSGAKFVLNRTSPGTTTIIATFLKDSNGVYYPDPRGTALVSDGNGHIAVKGLMAGSYTLTEEVAPSEYVLPTGTDANTSFVLVNPRTVNSFPSYPAVIDAVPFADLGTNTFGLIAKNSGLTFTQYTDDEIAYGIGGTLSASKTKVLFDDLPDYQAITDIGNVQKGSLPTTGGKGIVLIIAIGAALVIIGAFIWKRNRIDFDEA